MGSVAWDSAFIVHDFGAGLSDDSCKSGLDIQDHGSHPVWGPDSRPLPVSAIGVEVDGEDVAGSWVDDFVVFCDLED